MIKGLSLSVTQNEMENIESLKKGIDTTWAAVLRMEGLWGVTHSMC